MIDHYIVGVSCAIENVAKIIAPAMISKNFDVRNQEMIDAFLIELDGTANKCT